MFSKQPFPPCKVKCSTHKLYLMIIQNKASLTFGLLARNRLTDSPSFSNLITETRTLFALLDVLLYLSANGLKHPHCLPDVGIWSRVLKRLQVDGDSLRLGDDLSVVVVFRKFVRPFGDLEDSFLAVQVIESVHCNRLFVPRANNMIKIRLFWYTITETFWDKFALLEILHTRQTRIQLHLPNLSLTRHTILKTSICHFSSDFQHCIGWEGRTPISL